jgi:O-antigen ligase
MILATLILAAIVKSLSRMGFVATLITLFVLAVAARKSPARGSSKFRWMAVASFALLVVFGFFLLPSQAFIARFGGALSASELSNETRQQVWRDTLQLVARFPLFGCGFGAFQSAFMPYQTEDLVRTVNFVHNDYLEFLAELGIPAFACLITVAILLYRKVFVRIEGADDAYERCFYVACLGSMTAITIHSLTDFNLYMPANAFVLSWVSAMAAAPKSAVWDTESSLRSSHMRPKNYRHTK